MLLRGSDPARPGLRWWFTPGGGLDPGETPTEGAARELFEETGLRVAPEELGEPVWHQVTEFSYDNRKYRQEQDFYLYRVGEWQVDTAGFDLAEQLTIDQHRWWSAAELETTAETVFPANLADLLRQVTAPLSGRAEPAASSSVRPDPALSRPADPAASSSGRRDPAVSRPDDPPGVR